MADEVRTLAETSEKSARDIQELVGQIQQEVKVIAAGINAAADAARNEVDNGKAVVVQLQQAALDMGVAMTGSSEIATSALQSDRAAKEAQGGSEQIAAAATQQSADQA